ncbi:hypothetical protein [Desulfomarina profundi]|uniref:hypothetical protein n=1 Tax=Desulfomarina profundi TaxID=2772557 RepID=UPI001E4FFD1E|nr:hypothetical protein [Desulfomarina profundi]
MDRHSLAFNQLDVHSSGDRYYGYFHSIHFNLYLLLFPNNRHFCTTPGTVRGGITGGLQIHAPENFPTHRKANERKRHCRTVHRGG